MPKTPNEAYADTLLNYWARWARNNIISGHGYSSESIEYKLMRDGLIVGGETSDSPNDIAETLESIIIRMPEKMRKVTKIEYLVYASRKHKQEICHLGRRRYEEFLRRGQNWVAMEYDELQLKAM